MFIWECALWDFLWDFLWGFCGDVVGFCGFLWGFGASGGICVSIGVLLRVVWY